MAQLSDKELMREFYKSGASDFRKFKSAHLQQVSRSSESAAGTPSRANASLVHSQPMLQAAPATPTHAAPVIPATITKAPSAASKSYTQASKTPSAAAAVAAPIITDQQVRPAASPSPVPATVAPSAAKSTPAASAGLSQSTSAASPNSTTNGHPALVGLDQKPDGDTASRQYLQFLQQQQEVQRSHQKLQQQLERLTNDRKTCQTETAQTRNEVAELLRELETGKDWNLKSKYGVSTLLKDAMLKLQPRDLYHPEMKPQYLDVIQQQGNLDKLRKDHAKHPSYGDFKSHLDNAVRRLERAEKEIKASQLDGTNIARLPDTYFIQLDHILSTPTIEDVLQETENNLEDLSFKLEETKEKREQSLDEGEMQRAEEQYYDVVNHYEGILQLIREKLRTLERIKKESLVFDKVRQQYQEKAAEEASGLKREKEVLKDQCESDLRNVFSLKEKVDAVEAGTSQKLREDVQASDALLKKNDERQQDLWNQMRNLENELMKTEAERHAEVRRRVGMKEKDETRQMEYQRFCEVVEKHTSLLELTINNCDTGMHTTSLLGEMVNSGFNALQMHLHNHDNKYSQMLLDTHKQHLEQFRGLYLSLGELAHKKEKKIEEIDQAIKTNHIQQELAVDTLNPSAKKYSDAKKVLLRQRDQVDQELRELKEKAQYALDNFRESEQALHAARFAFVHPVVEQQEAALEMKAKMVEYRAIAVGNVDAMPIQQELQALKRELYDNMQAADPRSSMLHSTLPAITM